MQILENGFSNPNTGHVKPDDVGRAAIYYERGQSNNLWVWNINARTWVQFTASGGVGPQGPAGDPATQTPWAQAIDGNGQELSNAILTVGDALSPGEAVRLSDGGAAQAGIFITDEGFGPGLLAPIGSLGIYPGDGAYVKTGPNPEDWQKIAVV